MDNLSTPELVQRLVYLADAGDGGEDSDIVRQAADRLQSLSSPSESVEAELREQRDELGKVLVSFTPGGSEYFIRDGDGYRVDPERCKQVIFKRLVNAHNRLLKTLSQAAPATQGVEAAALIGRLETALRKGWGTTVLAPADMKLVVAALSAKQSIKPSPEPEGDKLDIGTRCKMCGTAAPTAFAHECNRPECPHRARASSQSEGEK